MTRLVEGVALNEVAAETGYSVSHVSRLHTSEAGRAEMTRLRAELETELANALPDMVQRAIEVLRAGLDSTNPNARRECARFVMQHLAKPYLTASLAETTQDGDVIDANQDGQFNQQPHGWDSHDDAQR